MYIIVHRMKAADMLEAYSYVRDELLMAAPDNVMYSYMGGFIKSYDGELCIDFRCGARDDLIGLRPDYYNSDSMSVLNYFSKCTECKDADLDKICNIAIDILKKGE